MTQTWAEPLVRPERLRTKRKDWGAMDINLFSDCVEVVPVLWTCLLSQSELCPMDVSVVSLGGLFQVRPGLKSGCFANRWRWPKLLLLGPQGRINLPCWLWTAVCDKTFFPGILLTGKEARGENTAGILSFQLLPTMLLTSTQQILLGCYCVCVRERKRACVLWRRLISLGPVFVVIGGATDPILCLLPLDIS